MSFLFPKAATPQPAPAPLPFKTSQDGAAISTAKLAAVQSGGYNSYNKTGGLGVPNVSTSSAALLGLS